MITKMTATGTTADTTAVSGAAPRAETALSALLALLMGAFLIFGVGFAQSEMLHDAAHDGRHAFAFPCH